MTQAQVNFARKTLKDGGKCFLNSQQVFSIKVRCGTPFVLVHTGSYVYRSDGMVWIPLVANDALIVHHS